MAPATATWQKIVCAVDFSDCARVALANAITLACQNGAQLALVHVLKPPVGAAMAEPIFPPADLLTQLETDLGKELERWRQSALDAGVERVTGDVIVAYDIHHALLDYAKKNNADAVVIGTHGRTGFKRLVLGSVAEHVVRHTHIPVVVVPPRAI
ncbi:MAG: universal stress protein [Deltaproteobacteria bacterium]|nr:universal stress protein [Deltaproteobacteria bacterium]